MNPEAFRARFAPLARVLTDRDSPLDDCARAAQAFLTLCGEVTPELGAHSRRLPTGKALSPLDASRCLLDGARTARFQQGVNAAIDAAMARFSERPLRVLYAGCGPFAPLVLPSLVRYSREELALTLVDIHQDSLDSARRILEHLDVADRLRASHRGDAGAIEIAPEDAPHVVIAEVMQRALAHEPQLAVSAHLVARAVPGALLVPSLIAVDLVLARVNDEQKTDRPPCRVELGNLIEITTETLPSLATAIQGHEALPTRAWRLPAELPDDVVVMLRTRIDTASGIALHDYESGLTLPQFLLELGPAKPGAELHTHYRLGPHPQFVCEWAERVDPLRERARARA